MQALLVGGPVATALLAAASLRLGGIVATILSAYVFWSAELVAVTLVLSPGRAVTRPWLGLAVGVLFVAALAAWLRRGRPVPVWRRPALDPLVVAFCAVAAVVLGYELVQVLATPPNNWDSYTYHLARVAFWQQHDGIHWVANAPNERINSAQPVAEQEIFFLSVAAGKGNLFALPQFTAQLAIIVASYGSARRLGYAARAAACAALLFGTFSSVALESTTAQNDLVAASFPAVAAFFLLDGGELLAGAATALAVGTKATTLYVVPVLTLLAFLRGRTGALRYAVSAACVFVVLALWSFVENVTRTGTLLGKAAGDLTGGHKVSELVALATVLFYRLPDLPAFHDALVWYLLAGAAELAVVFFAAALLLRRRVDPRRAALAGLPLAVPAAVILYAAAVRGIADVAHIPVRDLSDHWSWAINRFSDEDVAGLGPGGLLLLVAAIAALVRPAHRLRLALGLALPVFVVLLALSATYNDFLIRFMIVPAALTIPLAAIFFRDTLAGASILTVSAAAVAVTLLHNDAKPLDGRYGHPWQLSQVNAARLTYEPAAGDSLYGIDVLVPSDATLGAVVGPNEPAYLLFGSHHSNLVELLPRRPVAAVARAEADRLPFVVIGQVDGAAAAFEGAGWRLANLIDAYWRVAIDCRLPYVERLSLRACRAQ